MSYGINEDFHHANKMKIISLIKQIRERLNEINDGSFIVDPKIYRNYLIDFSL